MGDGRVRHRRLGRFEQLPEAAVRRDRQHRIALLKRNLLNLLSEEGPVGGRTAPGPQIENL